MMQNGLHIGLAAWIHQQQGEDNFVVYPANPIVTEPADLNQIQQVEDVAKAAEFAQLVNFIPRKGVTADVFNSTRFLWSVHRDLLKEMDFATQAWNAAQRTEYEAARDVLYVSGDDSRLTPSPDYILYKEMQTAYQDMVASGASDAESAQAYADWTVLGNRVAIQSALETIQRLYALTSSEQAHNERLLLSEDPVGVGLAMFGDLIFAPTNFAPMSASDPATWLTAKVTFDDLDQAVGKDPKKTEWQAYRANRTGEVTFDYVVVHCMRSWYTPDLYEADDWRLSSDEKRVSQGNGQDGLMPAYVESVYLVRVNDITIKAKPKPPVGWVSGVFEGTLSNARLVQPVVRSKTLGVGDPSLDTVKATPVLSARLNQTATLMTARTINTTPVLNPPRNQLELERPAATVSPNLQFTQLRLGQVQRLTPMDVNTRYLITRNYLEGVVNVPTTPPNNEKPSPIHVAGFGCMKISYAPNPNENYQWL